MGTEIELVGVQNEQFDRRIGSTICLRIFLSRDGLVEKSGKHHQRSNLPAGCR